MSQDSTQHELTEEELRELIPQLQQLTDKYKRAERVQKALFDISELASSVSHLNRLYSAIHEIIADFMNALFLGSLVFYTLVFIDQFMSH